ncbi:MAG: sigma-70 family RNA polymerase sigma factor [Acidobacteria bacterium]|nr:sigma-70 family RNA polymerase sigma factor [Acidobacteriota bacterium]
MARSTIEVTQLLTQWGSGDQAALEKLLPLIYDELHQIAKRHMDREQPGHTLQTTALIHEAYLRLVGQPGKQWQNRAHFFAVAAQVMRHVLVDYARARHAAKRGTKVELESLEEAAIVSRKQAAELIAIDKALTGLTALYPRQARVVELRYFGGLKVEEAAEILNVSEETVTRDWRMAKAWLYQALAGGK